MGRNSLVTKDTINENKPEARDAPKDRPSAEGRQDNAVRQPRTRPRQDYPGTPRHTRDPWARLGLVLVLFRGCLSLVLGSLTPLS